MALKIKADGIGQINEATAALGGLKAAEDTTGKSTDNLSARWKAAGLDLETFRRVTRETGNAALAYKEAERVAAAETARVTAEAERAKNSIFFLTGALHAVRTALGAAAGGLGNFGGALKSAWGNVQQFGTALVPYLVGTLVAVALAIAPVVLIFGIFGAGMLTLALLFGLAAGVAGVLGVAVIALALGAGQASLEWKNLTTAIHNAMNTLGKEATPMAKVFIDNLTKWVPILQGVAEQLLKWMSPRMPEFLRMLNLAFSILLQVVERIGGSFGRLFDLVAAHMDVFGAGFSKVLNTIAMLIDGTLFVLESFALWFIKNLPSLQPIVSGMAKTFQIAFGTVLMIAGLVLSTLAPMLAYLKNHMIALQIAAGILGVVLAMPLLVIALLVVAFIGLAVAVQFAGEHIFAFVAMVIGALGRFFSATGTVVRGIITLFGQLFSAIGSFFARIVAVAEAGWRQFTSRPIYWIAFMVAYIFVQLIVLWGRYVQWNGQMLGAAAAWAGNMINQAIRAGGQFFSNLGSYFSQLPGRVGSWLAGVLSRTSEFVNQMGAHGNRAGQNFLNNLLNILAGIPGRVAGTAWGIGASIAQGVARGITANAGTIVSAATGALAGALAGAKRAAGIASPAAVFAQQIGQPIAQGVALGIQQASGQATGALRALVGGLAGQGIGIPSVGVGLRTTTQGGVSTPGLVTSPPPSGAITSGINLNDTNGLLRQLHQDLLLLHIDLTKAIGQPGVFRRQGLATR
jgi:hypothetical protein